MGKTALTAGWYDKTPHGNRVNHTIYMHSITHFLTREKQPNRKNNNVHRHHGQMKKRKPFLRRITLRNYVTFYRCGP
jgi:hypothetical protein